MALTTRGRNENGTSTRSEGSTLEPPRRRVRLPETAVGLLVMIGFALAAVLWHTSTTRRDPALALATDVRRGDVLEASDLTVVYLSSDDLIAHVPPEAQGDIVGQVAVADLGTGTLLSQSQVAPGSALGVDDGVVGLALDPGQFPALDLRPGDRVNVVTGPPEGGDGSDSSVDAGGVLSSGAAVYAVEDLGTEGRRFVSLQMPETEANLVARAAEQGPVRLVLVER